MPEKTAAQKRAQKAYMEKFSVARVRMDPAKYERVQSHATAKGESVNGFINRAIQEAIERDGVEDPQTAVGGAQRGGVSLPPDTIKAAQMAAEAAGEAVPQFIARAVSETAERDRLSQDN